MLLEIPFAIFPYQNGFKSGGGVVAMVAKNVGIPSQAFYIIQSNSREVADGTVSGNTFGFGVGSMTIDFDARYWLGLSSIDDSAAIADIKNKVIQFMASLGF